MNLYSNKKSAFTLVELLISITILGLMAAMSISAYPKFAEQVGMSSETYKMLAYAKETQVYGVSSYSTPGVKFIYGFYINKSAGTLTRYKIEAPIDKTNLYYVNSSTLDQGAEVFTLKNIYKIDKICGDADCNVNVDNAYNFFKRPNPEGRLIGMVGSTLTPGVAEQSMDRIEITVVSKKTAGLSKKIVILQTGQMYVSDW